MNTIIAHPSLKFGVLSDIHTIDELQIVSIVQLIFWFIVCVTLICMSVKVRDLFKAPLRNNKVLNAEKRIELLKADLKEADKNEKNEIRAAIKAAKAELKTLIVEANTEFKDTPKEQRGGGTSQYNVRQLFEKLQQKYPKLEDAKIYFGGKRRFNKHFLYRVKTKMLQFPKNWETEKSFKIEFWTVYNFVNLVDIKTSSLNYVTKSLWPNILMIIGLTFSTVNVALTCILPIDWAEVVGAIDGGFGWSIFTLFGLSTLFIIIGWTWWFFLLRFKMTRFVKELTRGVLEDAERDRLIRLYKNISVMPLLINVASKEMPSKSMVWDDIDPEELQDLIIKYEEEARREEAKKRVSKK